MPRYVVSYNVILWFLLLFAATGKAQHQYDVWQFGNGSGIDFRTTPPTVTASGGPTNTFEGTAVYCDATGVPVITCDGINIFDKTGGVMANGSGVLGGDSTSTQGATIVPWPCSPGKFLVINTDLFGYIRNSFGSHYSIVDLNQNGGLGAVTQKNIKINDSTNEQCAVVPFNVGPDYWVILHNGYNHRFYSYRVTDNGFNPTPVVSDVGDNSEVGYLKASSDGRKLIMACYFELHVEIFDFDPSTGVVSNPLDLFRKIRNEPYFEAPYGACFSPDNTKVYFSVELPKPENTRVYQANLSAGSPTAIINSIKCITDSITPAPSSAKIHYAMEIGPDGKIYVSTSSIGISVIDNPNVAGLGCNFNDSKYILAVPPVIYRNAGLPNNIEGKSKIIGVDTSQFLLRSADTLFAKDTVTLCGLDTQTVTFNALECDSIVIASSRIGGASAGDYAIFDTTARKIGGEYRVKIVFTPKNKGLRSAYYELILGGGYTVRIPLNGIGADSNYTISINKIQTANSDSVALCHFLVQQYSISSGGCNIPAVVFQSVSGTSEFALASPAPKILTGNDQITIAFSPVSLGTKTAIYTLILADGRTLTIPLTAKGINNPVALSLSSPTIFAKDSLALCDYLDRRITLAKNSCSIVKILSQTLSGSDAGDYTVTNQFFDSLLESNDLIIRFHPTAVGLRNALYTIIFDNGQTILIPLLGSGINQKNSIHLSDAVVFSTDSLILCDSTEFTVHLNISGCGVLHIASQSLTGSASGDYTVLSKPADSLSTDNTLSIRFHPSAFGKRIATYTIVYDDGRSSAISLEGTGIKGSTKVTLSQLSLFANDSLDLCDSDELSLTLFKSGCADLHLISQSLSGNNPADYAAISLLPDSIEANNVLKIRFHPSGYGSRDASYVMKFDDSSIISIPLLGIGINGPTTVTLSGTDLFASDSLTLCDSTEHSIQVTLQGCGILHVTSQAISGPAASDYEILSPIADSVETLNTLNIRFHPSSFGIRSAAYTITFDNGKTFTVSLSGAGISPGVVALQNIPDFSTQIIGGDIHVPITIVGLHHQLPVELTVHFDNNLVYRGSHSVSGNKLDIPGTTTSTSSRLLIPTTDILFDTISAYSDFDVFVDSEQTSHIMLDSLDLVSPVASCFYVPLQTSVSGTVTGPAGCGVVKISDFLRYDKTPMFQIYPNPSSGVVNLASSNVTGEVTIRISDALGRVIQNQKITLSPLAPAAILLQDCPSGMYILWITGVNYSLGLPLVMQH